MQAAGTRTRQVREAYEQGRRHESERIERELRTWLLGEHPEDAGLVAGRRIVTEIDRICKGGRRD